MFAQDILSHLITLMMEGYFCSLLALFKNELKRRAVNDKYISQLEKTEEPHRKMKLLSHCLSFWLSFVQYPIANLGIFLCLFFL